jgi:hypothetical protein
VWQRFGAEREREREASRDALLELGLQVKQRMHEKKKKPETR